MIVVGLDPGLNSYGMARYDIIHDGMMVCCIRPRRDDAAQSKADDRARRAQIIFAELGGGWLDEAAAVCAEQLTWPRGVVGAGVIGIAWGVTAAAAQRAGVPLVMMTTKDARKHAIGRRGASKADIQAWARDRWPEAGWSPLKAELPDQADAALIAWACAHHAPALRLLRRATDDRLSE